MRNTYRAQSRELTQEQFVESLGGILGADFFAQYHMMNGHLDTSHMSISNIGQWRRNAKNQLYLPTVQETGRPLEALIKELAAQGNEVKMASFKIAVPEDSLLGYGFREETYAGTDEDFRPELDIFGSIIREDEWGLSVTHAFDENLVYEHDIDAEAELRKTNAWYADLDKVFAKVAPHLPIKQPVK